MTREEALEWFKDRKKMYCLDDKCQQAEDMAIKALEQEPILDKIRAEIEEHAKINQNLNTDRARALCWCLDVIGKYRAKVSHRKVREKNETERGKRLHERR